jgi:hypothetical protein
VPADHATVQAALDASASGDEVVLATGTYLQQLAIPAHSLTLRSATGFPDDVTLQCPDPDSTLMTFIGDPAGLRTVRGVTFTHSRTAAIVPFDAVSGVVRFESNRFVENGADPGVSPGACLRLSGGAVEVVDNEFLRNRSSLFGGAITCGGNLLATGNTFDDNAATPFGSSTLTQGGAIYLTGIIGRTGLAAEIRDNVFVSNDCTDYGGAINVGGWTGDVLIARNEFRENFAEICAGAVYVFGANSRTTIRGNVMFGNRSAGGAAIAAEFATGLVIRNNTIIDSRGGLAVLVHDLQQAVLENNLVAFNRAGGISFALSDISVSCNNSFGNAGPQYQQTPPAGNVSVDPLLCDLDGGDYHLQWASPGLPANSGGCGLVGALGFGGCGSVAVEPMSWGSLKAMHR